MSSKTKGLRPRAELGTLQAPLECLCHVPHQAALVPHHKGGRVGCANGRSYHVMGLLFFLPHHAIHKHTHTWRCSAWTQARKPFIADIMLLAKGLRLGSLRHWRPPCLRLCGIVPDKAVWASGMDQDSRWRKRCDDLYRIPRSWLLLPEEELEPKRRELQQLAQAGRRWAAGDKHPWEIFVTSLHSMFLAVLQARKLKDDESGLLFPVPAQNEKRDTYPWHHLQLPQPRGIPPKIPIIGQLPREWKWVPDLLPMVLRWHAELEWIKMPPAHERIPRAHW